jgi:hypothetical protein
MFKMKNTHVKNKSNIKLITGILLLLSFLFALNGCMSPQERNGVSLLPQNRPASWESTNSLSGGRM